jgi:hypothetical protein
VTDFLVRRDNLRESRVVESTAPDPDQGEALLRVGSFGLTANNVTYGVFGESMSYWDFFPTEEGWGRIPVWGFAEVAESRVDGVEAGTRVFGYLPPSSHLVVRPADASVAGFVDASAHRAKLPSAYQRYLATGPDPFHRPDTEEIQMLLRPLFFTSFLLDDQLDDEGLLDQGPVLISSASSKTALGVAHLLRRRQGARTVGLTSGANAAFVQGLDVYDEVRPYEEIGSLDRRQATYVDVAGDAEVRESVHSRYGDSLVRSIAVGFTHWEEGEGAPGELAGPAPTFFFAPDRVTKRSDDWGREGLATRVAEAWQPFCDWVGGWLTIDRERGFEALSDAYREVLEGRVGPDRAHVISVG